MSRRPRIAVTGPDQGGAAAWWFTRVALWRAGARARRVTPSRPRPDEPFDGLVIGGGADIAPELYGVEPPSVADTFRDDPAETAEVEGAEAASAGEATGEATGEDAPRRRSSLGRRLLAVAALGIRKLASIRRLRPSGLRPSGVQPSGYGDSARDELETRLIDEALASDKPILGICRGAQLLNVHFGGTLHRDLASFYVETPQITTLRPRKRIAVEASSLLADILRTRECRVNALHEQAVDRLARGLRIVAREKETGVVQAIEDPRRRFLLGVQWHPEYLPQVSRQHRIFRRLVAATQDAGAASDELQSTSR